MNRTWSVTLAIMMAICLGNLTHFFKNEEVSLVKSAIVLASNGKDKTIKPSPQNSIVSSQLSPSQTGVDTAKIKLKTIYKDYFPIGAAADTKPFLIDPVKSKFIAYQYNSITPANQLKPTRIQPQEGTFAWAEADKTVQFAKKNGMKIRGHFLISPRSMPNWFFKDGDKIATKEILIARMKSHITTVMRHFKGDIYCWDVVNEAISNDFKFNTFRTDDMFFQIIGEDYIKIAYEFARQADPSAILFYNENGLQNSKKFEKVYTFIKNIKKQGVKIDAIGMQCHLGIDGIDENLLRQSIDKFSALGLQVQITELDVSIFSNSVKKEDVKKLNSDYTEALQAQQSKVYAMVFKVCREKKDKVTGITFWAPADWNNQYNKQRNRNGYQYIFSEDLSPKKAYFDIINIK